MAEVFIWLAFYVALLCFCFFFRLPLWHEGEESKRFEEAAACCSAGARGAERHVASLIRQRDCAIRRRDDAVLRLDSFNKGFYYHGSYYLICTCLPAS